jgi:predicted permease
MRRRLRSRSGGDSAMRRRLRYVLVASQTALALVMLSGGLLLARSLARLEGIDLGYQAEHLSFLEASWPTQKLGTGAQLYPLGERLVKQWRAIPGVISVTPIIIPPLEGPNVFLGRLDVEGQSDADRASNPFVPVEGGNEDYFKTFGIPIVRGRGFQDGDRENAQQVAVVSEAIVRRFWPNENPIGKRIHFWGGADTTTWRTIVGVTGDVHLRSMREATPAVYIAWRQADFWQNTVAIRTSGTLASVLPALRREMKTVEPQLNLWYAKSMDDLLAEPLAQPRMSALLMGAFGVAALLLAAIGLYGVMAAVVRDGTREIGIRMALGAGPERLRREVLGRALLVSGAGAIAGGAVALGTSRLLATLLFEVSPTDPVSLVGAGAALMIVVILAAYVPARRATRIDPARALRAD